MGPRPYSEKASLPNDSAINESLPTVPTQVLLESPSPSTNSATTTPSPTLQEVIPVEQHVDNFAVENSHRIDVVLPYYPTPDDIMPYDHSLPDFIRQITNQPNLSLLQSLSLRVISSCISLHRMAAYLPSLKELNLEGSILNSLRDVGCSFKNLQILKVNCCQLESLDGTFGLSSLRELYAQKNLINDISPCSNLPHIKHIDVSWNKIRNISYTGFLSACNKLRSIVFTGNPATEIPDYRKHIRRILPQIEVLDGINFNNDEESEAVDNVGYESDSSAEVADFFSISTSDSLNNLLESEEDVNLLDKRIRETPKNVTCQNQCNTVECEMQDSDQNGMDVNQNLNARKKWAFKQKIDTNTENSLTDKTRNMAENFPSVSTSRSEISATSNINFEESKFGSITNIPEASGSLQKSYLIPDQYNFVPVVSTLTTGQPIRGNLTAALRNRSKTQSYINSLKLSATKDSALNENKMENNNCEKSSDSEGNSDCDCKDAKEN